MSKLSALSKKELVDFLYGYCQQSSDLRGISKQVICRSNRVSLDRARYAIINSNRPILTKRLLAISIIFDYAERNRCKKQLSLSVLCKQPDAVLFSASADIVRGHFPTALQRFLLQQLTLMS